VVDVVSSDRRSRAVQATWHCHPNAVVALNSTTHAAVVQGVHNPTGVPTAAQLAVIPATASVTIGRTGRTLVPGTGVGAGGSNTLVAGATGWSRAKVVKGQLAGNDGATEDQGWFSKSYADASAAPVLVYDAVMASGQTQAVFAWLLVPTAAAAEWQATAVITSVGNSSVSVSVRVGDAGKPTAIVVPFEV
jgi:hypothetical protein